MKTEFVDYVEERHSISLHKTKYLSVNTGHSRDQNQNYLKYYKGKKEVGSYQLAMFPLLIGYVVASDIQDKV